jgi:hypothetical protein
MYNPPLNVMENILCEYTRIIVKLFWIILVFTEYGKNNHTHLPFDYFTLATIILLKDQGLYNVNNQCILRQDTYLYKRIPDATILQYMDIELNTTTRIR